MEDSGVADACAALLAGQEPPAWQTPLSTPRTGRANAAKDPEVAARKTKVSYAVPEETGAEDEDEQPQKEDDEDEKENEAGSATMTATERDAVAVSMGG